MNSLYKFIVTPLNKRYNNEINVGNKKLIINSSVEEFTFISREAKVIAIPSEYKTEIKIGDTIIIHHNVFRRWYDQKGIERNSSSYFKDDLYFVQPDQIFMYKHNNQWETFGDYCFVKPIKNDDPITNIIDKKLVGILKYGNKYLEDQDVLPGDLVSYPRNREWEFVVDQELLYCMKSTNIIVKHEYQGHEAEYNPRWAQSC
ncbi:MAG: hypothetical protein QGI18_05795 [Candidatus Marinimicrobia bacterium]|jgi:hypothetical protein|nr:hypothetical protein [Candidatus Neomarinimicrobiota bacterium]